MENLTRLNMDTSDYLAKNNTDMFTPDSDYEPATKLYVDTEVSGISANVLPLDNTTPFTPDADYEPATKLYVDENSGGTTGGTSSSDFINCVLPDDGTSWAVGVFVRYVELSENGPVGFVAVSGIDVDIYGGPRTIGVIIQYDSGTRDATIRIRGIYEDPSITSTGRWYVGDMLSDSPGDLVTTVPSIGDEIDEPNHSSFAGISFEIGSLYLNFRFDTGSPQVAFE